MANYGEIRGVTNTVQIAEIPGSYPQIELGQNNDYICWRYVGDVTWTNLVYKGDLRGTDGVDGVNGVDGTNAYVYIRYAAQRPTQDSHLKTTPDAWMGIYSGTASTAPTAYTAYSWYNIGSGDGSSTGGNINVSDYLAEGANITLTVDSSTGVVTIASTVNISEESGSGSGMQKTSFTAQNTGWYRIAEQVYENANGVAIQDIDSDLEISINEVGKCYTVVQMLDGEFTDASVYEPNMPSESINAYNLETNMFRSTFHTKLQYIQQPMIEDSGTGLPVNGSEAIYNTDLRVVTEACVDTADTTTETLSIIGIRRYLEIYSLGGEDIPATFIGFKDNSLCDSQWTLYESSDIAVVDSDPYVSDTWRGLSFVAHHIVTNDTMIMSVDSSGNVESELYKYPTKKTELLPQICIGDIDMLNRVLDSAFAQEVFQRYGYATPDGWDFTEVDYPLHPAGDYHHSYILRWIGDMTELATYSLFANNRWDESFFYIVDEYVVSYRTSADYYTVNNDYTYPFIKQTISSVVEDRSWTRHGEYDSTHLGDYFIPYTRWSSNWQESGSSGDSSLQVQIYSHSGLNEGWYRIAAQTFPLAASGFTMSDIEISLEDDNMHTVVRMVDSSLLNPLRYQNLTDTLNTVSFNTVMQYVDSSSKACGYTDIRVVSEAIDDDTVARYLDVYFSGGASSYFIVTLKHNTLPLAPWFLMDNNNGQVGLIMVDGDPTNDGVTRPLGCVKHHLAVMSSATSSDTYVTSITTTPVAPLAQKVEGIPKLCISDITILNQLLNDTLHNEHYGIKGTLQSSYGYYAWTYDKYIPWHHTTDFHKSYILCWTGVNEDLENSGLFATRETYENIFIVDEYSIAPSNTVDEDNGIMPMVKQIVSSLYSSKSWSRSGSLNLTIDGTTNWGEWELVGNNSTAAIATYADNVNTYTSLSSSINTTLTLSTIAEQNYIDIPTESTDTVTGYPLFANIATHSLNCQVTNYATSQLSIAGTSIILDETTQTSVFRIYFTTTPATAVSVEVSVTGRILTRTTPVEATSDTTTDTTV